MKPTRKITFTILFLSLIVLSSNAQKKMVYGKVMAFQDIPIELADVTIKKSKTTTFTDSLGVFQIESKIKDKISIKVVGFKTSTVKVKNYRDTIFVNLVFNGEEEDLVLAANKGHLHKMNLPKAIKSFNTPKPYSFGYTSMEALVKGKFPQVEIRNGIIQVRGGQALQIGSSSEGALVVIDGVQADWSTLQSIMVTNIKRMELLKGSAASRYGSGGSNGVLYVKTN